jgi:hypothetical protein
LSSFAFVQISRKIERCHGHRFAVIHYDPLVFEKNVGTFVGIGTFRFAWIPTCPLQTPP